MQSKHWVKLIVVLFILVDLAFSFGQYYGKPLDGDMASIIVPAEHLGAVLDDPFGFQILRTGEGHAASNRYVAHKILIVFFENTTAFFRNVTSPINAIYLTKALFLWLTHLLLLLVISRFIGRQFRLDKYAFIWAAVFIIPLFQSNGYHVHMGLVSGAVSYASAYAFPMGLLLYFFYPFFRKLEETEYNVSIFRKIISLPLIILLAFNGPIIPPVGIIISALILLFYFYKNFISKENKSIATFLNTSIFFSATFILISCYSFYIGTFNAENAKPLPLGDRYLAMIGNVFPFITQKLGLPILIVSIIINTILLNKKKAIDNTSRITNQLKWILAFAIIYLLLLPLGGYRSYRSGIIRHDTFIPIAIALIYYFGLSTNYLWTRVSLINKNAYRLFVIAILLIYTFADKAQFDKNACEKKGLYQLANAKENPTKLSNNCTILSWENISDPTYSKLNAQLLQRWMVTEDTVLYYQK